MRSIDECIASVRIATEPVIAPAAIFSAMRIALEAIDSAAARVLTVPRRPGWAAAAISGPAMGQFSSSASSARAARPRWLIASFSAGSSSAIVRPSRDVVGHEGGVVAEAAVAARLVRERAGAASLDDLLGAVLVDVGQRADVRERRAGGRLAQELGEVLLVGGVLAGIARRAHAGRAAERLPPRCPSRRRSRAGRSRRTRRAPCPARCRRTCRRSRAADRRRRAGRRSSCPVQQRLELAHLVRVAGREDEPHTTACACTVRRCSMPPAASASRSSRCARDSGVRSAVAWTSISPPSPVITTLASTSAVESSE